MLMIVMCQRRVVKCLIYGKKMKVLNFILVYMYRYSTYNGAVF